MTGRAMRIHMRAPCRHCDEEFGNIERNGGQAVVRCANCGVYQYCAPKRELGEQPFTVRRRPDIKPSTKARILERDNSTCVVCHSANVPLHVGHLLSVDDGEKVGATEDELYHDDNLCAMCDECNQGQRNWTVSLRLVYRILQARIRMTNERDG